MTARAAAPDTMDRHSTIQDILFGDERHPVELPGGGMAARIEPAAVLPPGDGGAVIGRALASPIGSPPLRELARGKGTAAILVPGRDRVAGAEVYVPLLLAELNAGGIPDERIEVVLATGTHARHSVQEVARVLGAEAVSRVRWREHDGAKEANLRRVGATRRGSEVLFDRGVLEADLKVLTGRIIPHYFAGYGGGRKALMPGVAGFRSILANHRLTLAEGAGIHPCVRPCRLEGNPVHLDMLEAARMVEGTFVLNTLLDTSHAIIGAYAGQLEAAHAAGCREAEGIFRVCVPEPLDAVIAAAGGAPYDGDFMQALKAVFDVQDVVRPGGAILWVARCPAGMKKAFLRWGAIRSDEELDRAVRADYDLCGHNSIMLRRLTRKARVALWSALPDAEVRAMGIEPVHSAREGVDWLVAGCRGAARYGVVPFGNVTYAALARE